MLSARGVSRASAILPSFHLKQFITFTNPVLIHKFLQCEILQRVLHGKSAFSGLTLAIPFSLLFGMVYMAIGANSSMRDVASGQKRNICVSYFSLSSSCHL